MFLGDSSGKDPTVGSASMSTAMPVSNAKRFIEVDHLSVSAIGRGNGEAGETTSVKLYAAESIQ